MHPAIGNGVAATHAALVGKDVRRLVFDVNENLLLLDARWQHDAGIGFGVYNCRVCYESAVVSSCVFVYVSVDHAFPYGWSTGIYQRFSFGFGARPGVLVTASGFYPHVWAADVARLVAAVGGEAAAGHEFGLNNDGWLGKVFGIYDRHPL